MPMALPRPAAPIRGAEQHLGPASRRSGVAEQERHEHRQEAREPARPQLARSANATAPGIRVRARPGRDLAGRAGQHHLALALAGVDLAGSRIAQIVASTNNRNA